MKTRRLTTCALLTAIALTIFVAEAQIPLPVPVPGMKLGLANIVTVYAMFAGLNTFPYSLAGGMSCYLIMLLLRKLVSEKQLWVCGAVSSIFHNLGQVGMAILITGTPKLVVYLVMLLPAGIVAGVFTGLAAQFLLARLKKGGIR